MIVGYYCPAADVYGKTCKRSNPTTCQMSMDYHCAINYSEVDFTGVKSILVSCDSNGDMKIIQANGYTDERGEFCDEY